LRAATAGSGHGDALRIDFGKTQKKVERADGVPGLQAHGTLQVRLGLWAEEAPALSRVHFWTLLREAVNEAAGELNGIGIAQHIPLPNDATHSRQLDAHGLKAAATASFESFLTGGDFLPEIHFGFNGEARVLPMSVREQNAWSLASDAFRSIEISRDVKARRTFEIDLRHSVFEPVDSSVDDRTQRGFCRHGPKSLRDEDSAAHELGALRPFDFGFRWREWEVAVQIFERLEPNVIGQGRGVRDRLRKEKQQSDTRREDHRASQRCGCDMPGKMRFGNHGLRLPQWPVDPPL